MKSYTNLEQSKKLAEILPLESADFYYDIDFDKDYHIKMPINGYFGNKSFFIEFPEKVPCWSLAALLEYLSANFRVDIKYLDNYWEFDCRVQVTYNKELVDACVTMIENLHEQKIL